MVVQNDLTNLGDLQFYEVPLNSTTKLIGPTAVREALDRDPEFAQLKTPLRNPRIGDNILVPRRATMISTLFLYIQQEQVV